MVREFIECSIPQPPSLRYRLPSLLACRIFGHLVVFIYYCTGVGSSRFSR